ncbi:2-isopropylmalate synthase [Lentisphaera profundi]|uniref:2-isopropylmalate synthase n=1 Tax=Lentisphaera profundi TaxID=1658616 RepID=A0ABY7VNK2_9BACT|nr:2-isopropylmalate synthase [Lentisphaera profundi]WDE95492.1 2-isopropylmalate synthase [Lentisphaera profundi]
MKKYSAIPEIGITNRTWPDTPITQAPRWCAVDLRDGNQALPDPLTLEQKKTYFDILVKIGFKEIEIGFPSASKDDYDFCRHLIENKLIPDDVMISVLVPARPDLVSKTMYALRDVPKATVHFYVATSDLHREHVLGKSRQDVFEMCTATVQAIKEEASKLNPSKFYLEFSPEEFTDTDLDFAVEICDHVINEWQPAEGEQVILNLPATVERRPPTHYADMIELFQRKLKSTQAIISLHAHNDMGCAVASSQLAIQAGAHRVEGTLFGQGERSGNVDLITLVLNLQYLGVDTGLDFSDLMNITETISQLTNMPPHERHPYVGSLVFSAFSGSHQDAIHKSTLKKDALMETFGRWKIPYLHIDPADIGREFENLIRINSQSGKGGIAHIIEKEHNIKLPRFVQIDFAKRVQAYAEAVSREVSTQEVWRVFEEAYINPKNANLSLSNYWPYPDEKHPEIINAKIEVLFKGKKVTLEARDNGPISAFVAALKQLEIPSFTLEHFGEDSIGDSAQAEAVSCISIKNITDENVFIGFGYHSNINQAAVRAIVAAVNNLLNQ